MEPIIAIVGFLGAGKTTLLQHLIDNFSKDGWNPFVVLNDYENAYLDAQRLTDKFDNNFIKALNGSCICCSGISELRDFINNIPLRKNGITLIEANGTSDACSLMGFLGVGIEDRFMPPVQISIVDVKNWQLRDEYNELEANQVQVSSVIVLSHIEGVLETRKGDVIESLKKLNPGARILEFEELTTSIIAKLVPSKNSPDKLEHHKAHWASCSVDLPTLPSEVCIQNICTYLPKSIQRVKGCTKIGIEEHYTFFERTPDGNVSIRQFKGIPTTGPKLLTVGPGSDPTVLEKAINESMIN